MSWKRNLRPASFRGVEFHVDGRDLSGGRRIKNHDYPKKNDNFPEDMGRKTRSFNVSAYIVGDDYAARRDALIDACEREGAGSYVDFWGRSQRVVCEDYNLVEEQHEGRMCRIDMVLLNAGARAFPAGVPATSVQLATSAAGLLSAAKQAFAAKYGI